MWQKHGIELQRDVIVNNTEILARESDPRRLAILEALYIKDLNPTINNQVLDLAILPSMRPVNPGHLHGLEDSSPAGRRAPHGVHSPSAAPSREGRPRERQPAPVAGTPAPYSSIPRRSARIEERNRRQPRPASQAEANQN